LSTEVNVIELSARLTDAAGPIARQTICFRTATQSACSAVTNIKRVATCSAYMSQSRFNNAHNYLAICDGTPVYAHAGATGTLTRRQ
jgi:hypothetical protein